MRDEAFIQFFANSYVRERMFQPPAQNYWLGVDNCIFFIEAYGVLDDSGVFHYVSQFDPPFAQSDPEFLDSIAYFLARLKTIAPDIQWEGPAGKAAILQALIPNDSTFRDKPRTAYMEYLIFRGANFFFGPTFIGPTSAGVPISDYAQMQQALGLPTGPAIDYQYGTDPGFRLYSRLLLTDSYTSIGRGSH